MKHRRLYIVGNGFDLHHRIPTEFCDFRQFVREHDSGLLKAIESYLSAIRADWSDLESSLATIEVEGIVNDLEQFMPSYGADKWSDQDIMIFSTRSAVSSCACRSNSDADSVNGFAMCRFRRQKPRWHVCEPSIQPRFS